MTCHGITCPVLWSFIVMLKTMISVWIVCKWCQSYHWTIVIGFLVFYICECSGELTRTLTNLTGQSTWPTTLLLFDCWEQLVYRWKWNQLYKSLKRKSWLSANVFLVCWQAGLTYRDCSRHMWHLYMFVYGIFRLSCQVVKAFGLFTTKILVVVLLILLERFLMMMNIMHIWS